jgi:hypothetical protein
VAAAKRGHLVRRASVAPAPTPPHADVAGGAHLDACLARRRSCSSSSSYDVAKRVLPCAWFTLQKTNKSFYLLQGVLRRRSRSTRTATIDRWSFC